MEGMVDTIVDGIPVVGRETTELECREIEYHLLRSLTP
jgi:hypothetical protein